MLVWNGAMVELGSAPQSETLKMNSYNLLVFLLIPEFAYFLRYLII